MYAGLSARVNDAIRAMQAVQTELEILQSASSVPPPLPANPGRLFPADALSKVTSSVTVPASRVGNSSGASTVSSSSALPPTYNSLASRTTTATQVSGAGAGAGSKVASTNSRVNGSHVPSGTAPFSRLPSSLASVTPAAVASWTSNLSHASSVSSVSPTPAS